MSENKANISGGSRGATGTPLPPDQNLANLYVDPPLLAGWRPLLLKILDPRLNILKKELSFQTLTYPAVND